MITTIIYTIVCLVALGLLFSVVLYLVAQKFRVEEDPRVDIIESCSPEPIVADAVWPDAAHSPKRL